MCKLKFLSKLTTVGGYIAAFGIVFAFIFGWLIMLFASLSFFGGFGVETVCKPLFRDDKMEIFQYVDFLKFDIANRFNDKKDVSFSFGEILKECKNNGTMFAAVRGAQLIDKDDITKDIDFDQSRNDIDDSIESNDIAFNFGDTDLSNINNDADDLRKKVKAIDAAGLPQTVADAITDVKTKSDALISTLSGYGDQLNVLMGAANKSKNFKNETKNGVDNLFNGLKKDFPTKVDNGVKGLEQNAYPCRSVYDIWQNIGVLACDRMGRPIQGVWTSTGLIAIIYIPTILMMIIISGILYQIDKKESHAKHESAEEERVPITQPAHHERQQLTNGHLYNQSAQSGGAYNNWGYSGNPSQRPVYPRLSSSGQQSQYY